ncbi:MAG: CHAT domain-containing protein [Afipia sp.]|nr:CHAT domain-containing protein [Afipia sp.]
MAARTPRRQSGNDTFDTAWLLRQVVECMANFSGLPVSFFKAHTPLFDFIERTKRRELAGQIQKWPSLRVRGARISMTAMDTAVSVGDVVESIQLYGPLLSGLSRASISRDGPKSKKRIRSGKRSGRRSPEQNKKAAKKSTSKRVARKSPTKKVARKAERHKDKAPRRVTTEIRAPLAKTKKRASAPKSSTPKRRPRSIDAGTVGQKVREKNADLETKARKRQEKSFVSKKETPEGRTQSGILDALRNLLPGSENLSPFDFDWVSGPIASSDPGFWGGRADRHAGPATYTPRRQPRYANAALLDLKGSLLTRKSSFGPDSIVRLRLDIGELSAESRVANPEPIPEQRLPTNVELDVMVSSTDLGVGIDEKALKTERPSVAHGGFFLPEDGDYARAKGGGRFLSFYLKTPTGLPWTEAAHARIGYYYRNVLIQSQRLTIWPGDVGGFKIITDFTTSDDLTGLDDIPERPRISILTNANDSGNHQIVIRAPGATSAQSAPGMTLEIKSKNVGETIKKLRSALSIRAPEEKRRDRSMLADDLRELAPIGWDLYTQLPGQVPASFFGDLRRAPENFVIQVTRPNTSSFVLPWSYIYEIPLYSGVTPTLCPMVEQWDGRTPLFSGAPLKCPCGPHKRDVLCPFGFWGYRYAIEQLASATRPVLTVPMMSACEVVVCETQYDVDLGSLKKHVERLVIALSKVRPEAKLREGKDKATIETLLGADVPFVYFYCHGERKNIADSNTFLGVGNRESITTSDFIGWTMEWYDNLNKKIWDKVRPLVFINACHSVAIEPETLVSYLDAFVGRGNAAGVIGTEVKVEQAMAMDVAESFFSTWMDGQHTVEMALRTIRLDYLRQGNLFGLVYTPYCWSELKTVAM